MSNDTDVGVYAQLDALLDTRIGTIARMSQDLAAEVLLSGYHTRNSDVFENVDPVEFKKLYDARDTVTLSMSYRTACVQVIHELVRSLAEQSITRPYHSGIKLVINLHPYVLTDEEKSELVNVFWTILEGACSIELTTLTEDQVTPAMCRSSFAAMFVYGHDQWLDMHTTALSTCLLPDIDMFAPALFRQAAPGETELQKLVRKSGHPFRAIEELAKPLIRLQLLDAKIFSVIES